jgi:hypothetical protein
MPYSVVSGTTARDLLAAIRTFAAANSWTVEYDDVSANGELGLSRLNCHVALTDGGNTSVTDAVNGGSLNDGRIYGGIGSSITTSNHHYYGHPGSIVTINGDSDRVVINDVQGPFSNIYLFTDATGRYINVAAQNTSDRYTHISFGNLNKIGMTHADIGYLSGQNYTWWPNVADYSANSGYGANWPGYSGHNQGFVGNSNLHLYTPNGVLNTAYGFASGDQQTGGQSATGAQTILYLSEFGFGTATTGRLLDHFHVCGNEATTGGAPLWPLPVSFADDSSDIRCLLGVLPDTCLFNMTGFSPKQIVTYGSDDWQIFPLKAAGSYENSNFGANAAYPANTYKFGLAYKRAA